MGTVPTFAEHFGLFFRSHVDHIRRYSATLVSVEAVDDVVQQSMVTAWQRFDAIPEGSEREWLFGVVRNHCRNSWRSGRRSEALIAAIEQARPQVTVAIGDNGFDPTEIAPLLNALEEVSDDECELLVLTGWFEMTPTEIASVMGIEPGTARVRLTRARSKIRERYAELTEEGEMT